MRQVRIWIPLLTAAAASFVACSSTDTTGPRNHNAAGASGSTDPGGGGGGGGGGSDGVGGSASGITFDAGPTRVTFDDDACAAEVHAAETLPLDMFIMMDQSGSMGEQVTGGTKWSVVTGALSTFVQSPGAAGMGAGIQYFGNNGGTSTPASDAGTTCNNPFYCPGGGGIFGGGGFGAFTSSCNASDYANPDVEIAPLPGNGGPIAMSLAAHMPISDTPTQPALQGAIDHATAWSTAHTGHPTIVVLATDGDPGGCNSTVGGVAQIAANGLAANPSILTFVIGVGASLTSLNSIAQSGGTTQAYVVDTGQDVTKQFLDALNKIRGSVILPCEYLVPASNNGAALDLNSVNVVFTPGAGPDAGKPAPIYQVTDMNACDANTGGWYYNDPSNPTNIELCQATCTTVTADTGGNVGVSVGCQTVKAPIH